MAPLRWLKFWLRIYSSQCRTMLLIMGWLLCLRFLCQWCVWVDVSVVMSCLIAANCLPYLPRCYWWVSVEVEWTGFVITVISSCNFLKSLWNLLLFSIEANSNLFIAFIIFLKIANLVSDEGIQVQSWNLNMMGNSLDHKVVFVMWRPLPIDKHG